VVVPSLNTGNGNKSTQSSKNLRIALLGNRGIPAKFGGSDTVFEQLGERLVKDGHYVVVYCRKHFSLTDAKYYKGMQRVVLPSMKQFSLETLSHSFLSTVHVLITNNADILNYHGIGNSLILPLLLFSRKKSVVVIDGPDWTRSKWNWFAKKMLRMSVDFAVWFADEIISDNILIHDWLKREYGKDTPVILYGADFENPPPGKNLAQWGLRGNDYILFVAMMVPDKGPDILLQAYSKLITNKKLLMVGDTPYYKDFFDGLKTKYGGNPNIIFTGFQYGDSYKEYMANAYIYAHPFRSDGTSPSLLQALALGNCVVANSVPETMAALQDGGLLFDRDCPDSLAEKLQYLVNNPEEAALLRSKAYAFATSTYNWDTIEQQYVDIFKKVLGQS
jgi:glycosyltransferase involved in cell wall biosynthesis